MGGGKCGDGHFAVRPVPSLHSSAAMASIAAKLLLGSVLAFWLAAMAGAEVASANSRLNPGGGAGAGAGAGGAAGGAAGGGAGVQSGYRCRGVLVDVVAGSRREIQLVCATARRTVQLLARSGLRLDSALRVHLVDQIRTEENLRCFGRFHPDERKIEVLGLGPMQETRHACPRYAAISLQAAFRSVVAHELAHALVDQRRPTVPLQRTAQEYIAYVSEISVMPPVVRRAFVGAAPAAGISSLDYFSELFLAIDPAGFAVRAWRHFRASKDRHRMLADILSGVTKFPVTGDAAD